MERLDHRARPNAIRMDGGVADVVEPQARSDVPPRARALLALGRALDNSPARSAGASGARLQTFRQESCDPTCVAKTSLGDFAGPCALDFDIEEI